MAIALSPVKKPPPAVVRFVHWIMYLCRDDLRISSIERSGPRRSHPLRRRKKKKEKLQQTVDWSHWSSNEIGNCLLASRKRRRKPFAPRVSKHRYCTPWNLARRALIRENQRHPAFPEDHLYRVAQILRLLRLFRDSFFSILSWTRPESFANLNEITNRNPRVGDINEI